MYKVDGNNISLTRGDTLCIQVNLLQYGTIFTPRPSDTIRFAMKKNINDLEVVLTKSIPIDTLMFELAPNETKELDYGSYVYDMEYTGVDGRVDTFLKGKFTLTEEVY